MPHKIFEEQVRKYTNLQDESLEKPLKYWKEKLSGFESLNLPTDYLRTRQLNSFGANYAFELETALSAQLRELSQSTETSLYTVLLSGYYLLLYSLSNQTDLLIGTPSDNGSDVSLPLRVEILSTVTIRNLIDQVHEVITQAKAHQELSFEQMADLFGADTSQHSLFGAMFHLKDFEQDAESLHGTIRHDLSLVLTEDQMKIDGVFSYPTNLFGENSIARMSEIYQHILRAFVSSPDVSLGDISVVSAAEKQLQLIDWNQTDVVYPDSITLQELFEQQVLNNKDKVAVVHGDTTITYGELNTKANQLARTIRSNYKNQYNKELTPDTLIALYLDRGVDMIVSMLAVLKAGGAYVPISPDYPVERVKFMLEDTQASVLISDRDVTDLLTGLSYAPVMLSLSSENLDENTSNLEQINTSNDLAYVIYTSGTTGQPKGVMVDHQGVVSFAYKNTYISEQADRVASLSPYSFDGFVFDAFYSLLSGASVYLIDKQLLLNPDAMCAYLGTHQIDTFFTTTALFNQLIRSGKLNDTGVRNILFGGEKADLSVISQGLKELDINLVHVYGPTETVVYASAYHFSGIGCEKAPIGSPLNNKRFYVVDATGKIVPVGCPGELWIGGAGISRGYLNREDLTAERFIDNPFITQEDKAKGYTKVYKTGDLVRWLPEGTIEFIGRIDKQVKIRGHRIEPAEIESILNDFEEISHAVVVDLDKGGNKYLAAYVVMNNEVTFSAEVLRSKLESLLPDYMVPSTFTELTTIPLTINGKLDRKALPDPEFTSTDSYVAPRTELEEDLCRIWEKVLGLNQIGVNDNFFRLGGDSINALSLSAYCRKQIGLDLTLALLYEHKTIAGISPRLKDQEVVIISRSDIATPALSFAQERLLFIERFEQGTSAYHIPYVSRLKEGVDVTLLTEALRIVINRHAVLKTVFLADPQGNHYQYVLDGDVVPEYVDLVDETGFISIIESEINKPFDLEKEPSVRLRFYNTPESNYLLLLWHHVAFDGWSTDIFLNELASVYSFLLKDEPVNLPVLEISYADYAIWQRNYLQGETLRKLLQYWENQLSGFETLNLPTDYLRPRKLDYQGRDYVFELDATLSLQLRELSRSEETTLYTVLLSGYYVMLWILSGQTDILIGTPSDNRSHVQTQDLIGFFVNSLPLRTVVDVETSIRTMISEVHQVVTQAKINQELPLERMVDKLRVDRDASRHPLFQVLFSLQDFWNNAENSSESPLLPVELTLGENLYSPARYDLSLLLSDDQQQIGGVLNYATSLFEESTIVRMSEMYERILQVFVSNLDLSVRDISVLSAEEKKLQLIDWNQTDSDYPDEITLQELFEKQVVINADKIALVYGETDLTYGELNARANQLARTIRSNYQNQYNKELTPDTFIALYLGRGVDTVVSMLAVLKAGGAYVPISPEYPVERIKFMLEDTQSSLMLLSQDELAGVIMDGWLTELSSVPGLVLVDDLNSMDSDTSNLDLINDSKDLAYVIYTSGTTGQPKGVLTPHRAVVSLVQNNDYVSISSEDVFVHLSSPNFDAATFEIWGALTHGSTLVVAPARMDLSPESVERLFESHNVSIVWLTRTLFDSLYVLSANMFGGLRYLLVGGEALTADLIRSLSEQEIRPEFILNGYGPTESTTFTTTYSCEVIGGNVPLGKPINTRKVYVLNESGHLVPVGSPGELHIAGAGLARGYLNRAALTAECFIDNVFATEHDKSNGYTKLYKTGDLVRWLADGNLEYLGRKDNQIKLRGYRVELGEIEQVLNAQQDVRQCVVVDVEKEGNKYLAAYVVMNTETTFSAEVLRSKLTTLLPDYMVPTTFTELSSIPLTQNGKLDRRSLPDPEFTSKDTYVAPTTKLEEQLCAIWQEVLGVERVGIHDNFFHIGGDSIVAIRVISKAKQQGLHFSVQDIFTNHAISDLSHKVVYGKDEKEAYKPFSLVSHEQLQRLEIAYSHNLSDAYPATFLQKGMLLESTMDTGVYHDVLSYKINAVFNQEQTETVLQELIELHEVIRTCFSEDEREGYLGIVLKKHQISLEVIETEIEQLILAEIEKSFDFNVPLYRVIISDIQEESFLLTMSFHHAIIDGWSVASLITDFTNKYRTKNNPISPKREVPMYGEYVRNEREVLTNPDYYKFWSGYLEGYDASGFSFVKASMSNELNQHKAHYKISEKESAAIFETARELGISVDTIFLSLYHSILCLFEGTNDLTIGLVTNNRLEKQGGDEQLGLFLNTIPFRPKPAKTSDVSAVISQLADEKNRVLKYKALPFAFIKSEWLSEVNNYQCAFNYTHFHINEGLDYEQNNMPVSVYEKINIPMLFSVIRQSESFEIILAAHKGSVNYFLFQQFWTYFQSSLRYLSEHKESLSLVSLPKLIAEDIDLLQRWNTTAPVLGADQTLHGLFESQVEKTPDAIALVFKDERLTYRELNARSNRLAHLIRDQYKSKVNEDLKPDSLIALYLDRSIEMVVAILGVLKAGGAYVPISPQYPSDRTLYLLEDTGATIVLSEEKYLDELTLLSENLSHSRVFLPIDAVGFASEMPASAVETSVTSTDLAYVIYTSGTTGQPKGVEITHGASASRNWFMADQSETKKNVYLFKTNYIFDVSVSDLFSHLFSGAQLVITESVFDLDEIESSGMKYGVNSSHFVPSQFPALTSSGTFQKELDRIYFSGESLMKEHLEEIDLSRTKVINYYGPTETGEATSYVVTSADSSNIIGIPLNGTQIYILTKEKELSPVGSPGELYVAGAGLARGYLNKPELTAERFIDNPFATESDKKNGYTKLYKTGDMARWLADGNLEYLGRMDNQIKLRGHRVELGEIESCLHTFSAIKQAVVVDFDKESGKFLAAYIVYEQGAELSEDDLVNQLSQILPDYMIPSTFTTLERIPLTQNGKLDRRALPEPQSIRSEMYVGPRNELEEKLCQIWQEVLGIEKVGIHDSFFRLGGDSMKAIQMTSVGRKNVGLEISLPLLFKHKSISNLAKHLEELEMIVIQSSEDLNKKISTQKNTMKL